MYRNLFLLAFVALMFFTCTPKSNTSIEKERTDIANLEKSLKEAKDVNKDKETAATLIQKSLDYVEKHPQDSLSPEVLFKAADVSRGLGNYEEAIRLWTKVYTEYQSYEKAADALFLKGFTYDKDLNDKAQAKQYLTLFMRKYPKHPLIKDVQLLLNYNQRNKSDLDLIKEFKKKSDGAALE